jgi:hypothetical protein
MFGRWRYQVYAEVLLGQRPACGAGHEVPVHPSHSRMMASSAVAACSSSRNTQQFPMCGLSTMISFSLVTSRLVNPVAPCVWQVVMITRRWLFRVVFSPPWVITDLCGVPAVMVGSRVKARSPCQCVRRCEGGALVRWTSWVHPVPG